MERVEQLNKSDDVEDKEVGVVSDGLGKVSLGNQKAKPKAMGRNHHGEIGQQIGSQKQFQLTVVQARTRTSITCILKRMKKQYFPMITKNPELRRREA